MTNHYPCKVCVQQAHEQRCVCRVGPPSFLGGILIVWGIVASLFAWMQTAMHFYALRFILGLAESGAYPGAPSQRSKMCWAL